MQDTVRKQYLSLAGHPVVSHSLITFDECEEIEDICLVVSQKDIDYCQKNILSPLKLQKKVHLVPGGPHRQASVYKGLLAIDQKTTTVVIHDGVRPFIQSEHLTSCILGTKDFGACILAIPASDTLKQVEHSGYIKKTLTRNAVWLAQTPQAFHYSLIMKAHETAQRDGFIGTDDALLVERMGKDVKVIKGSQANIKITTREDLAVAQAMIDAGLV
ncbi:MAG: 2-C-methyl-D-erythritol 4-phosphate cytidylyltransferase [Desulfobacterales bacterium]|nr:MAG: 2-C-methyl-D-erythritol 4-phosphate cytidylyltransferase [Desulfobacterales bacterium]